jgi:hypothetical protein
MATQLIRKGKQFRPLPKRPLLKRARASRIWAQGAHNAFTDLCLFQGHYYCVFREATAHVSPDGALRILKSADGKRWRSVALIQSSIADLRDGKLVVTPDNRLQLLGAGALHDRSQYSYQSYVWFSVDGERWSEAIEVGEPNVWLWRLTWQQGFAWAIGYKCGGGPRSVRLYRSEDGVNFSVWVQQFNNQGYPNESALLFLPDERAVCLLRRDPDVALLGIASPPYFDWQWRPLNCRVGGPQCLLLPDGRILAAVRLYDRRVRTSLAWLDVDSASLRETLQLPSAGDTSYAGMVWHQGRLAVSYYSSHQGRTAIYFSRPQIDPPFIAKNCYISAP